MTGSSLEPFVISGYSGCGKTSLLAKGYSEVMPNKDSAHSCVQVRNVYVIPVFRQ